MKKILILLIVIVILGLVVPVRSIPNGQGQQLFFDNFSTSQLSPNWNVFALGLGGSLFSSSGNLTQSGGWLTLTVPKSLAAGPCGGFCFGFEDIMANSITPIVSSATTSQFVYMAWRILAFNLTQVGNNPGSSRASRDATLNFGLFANSSSSPGTGQGIGIQLSEVDNVTDSYLLAPGLQRETAALLINRPQTGPTLNCFATNEIFLGPFNPTGCSSGQMRSIVYTNPNAPIDLNTPHIFTMEMNLKTDGSSWVAMEIDQNGWYNITQTACSCIEGSGETYRTMFPYIGSAYSVNNLGANPSSTAPSQSLGSLVNYVLVDNYVPSSLPASSTPPLTSSNNPIGNPTGTIFNPFGTASPANVWQYWANVLGSGVPLGTGNFLISPFYFGGSLLFAITVVLILAIFVFNPVHKVSSPFIISFSLFMDTIINFVLGTLPIYEFAGIAIFFMAVMAGTIPSTIGGSGVPS